MNIASALIKQTIEGGDLETWSYIKKDYLPSEYHRVFDYIDNDDSTVFEQDPLINLAKDGEIFTYKHPDFWKPMDSLKDKNDLNKLWNENKAPWKVWDK